jgi:hypothetical protein
VSGQVIQLSTDGCHLLRHVSQLGFEATYLFQESGDPLITSHELCPLAKDLGIPISDLLIMELAFHVDLALDVQEPSIASTLILQIDLGSDGLLGDLAFRDRLATIPDVPPVQCCYCRDGGNERDKESRVHVSPPDDGEDASFTYSPS